LNGVYATIVLKMLWTLSVCAHLQQGWPVARHAECQQLFYYWFCFLTALYVSRNTGWLKINTPPDNMQYLLNQWSDFKNF